MSDRLPKTIRALSQRRGFSLITRYLLSFAFRSSPFTLYLLPSSESLDDRISTPVVMGLNLCCHNSGGR